MKKYYSISQAVIMTSLSKRFLYKLCEEKKIKHYRIGKRIVIAEEDLEKFMENKPIEPENLNKKENILGRPKIEIDKDLLIQKYVKEKKRIKEISKIMKVSRATISNWILYLNLPRKQSKWEKDTYVFSYFKGKLFPKFYKLTDSAKKLIATKIIFHKIKNQLLGGKNEKDK